MSLKDLIEKKIKIKPYVILAATTPYAINAFLAGHIEGLKDEFNVVVCTNLSVYELLPSIQNYADVQQVVFERRISLIADICCLIALFRIFRKYRPVTVHSITPKAGLLCVIASFFAGVPQRWHTFTGQVWENKKGFVRYALKTLDRLIASVATDVFADSESQCEFLRNERVVKDDKIVVLGSGSIAGVDLIRFHPNEASYEDLRNEMGTNHNACVFLFVGRLARDKGVFNLVHAFHELSCKFPNNELWVVGPDEEGLLGSLKNAAKCCNSPVRWIGQTLTPERFMVAADVMLLPSYREGFGSVIIEAAACGVPVIAYRINGVIDAVVDGSGGILVELGNLDAFISAMQLLSSNLKLRLQLGRQARERAVQEFDSRKVTDTWVNFYRGRIDVTSEQLVEVS